jgi:cold-inducible RNA-binding protein
MSNTKYSVFVGGLSQSTDERELLSFFPLAINARVQRDRESGKSKGFGFLEFRSASAAQDSINQSGSISINGRVVRVSRATNNQETPLPRLRSRSRSPLVSRSVSPRSRDERRQRIRDRVKLASAGWDREPTREEIVQQQAEANAVKSSQGKGEITTIRAELMKAAASSSRTV